MSNINYFYQETLPRLENYPRYQYNKGRNEIEQQLDLDWSQEIMLMISFIYGYSPFPYIFPLIFQHLSLNKSDRQLHIPYIIFRKGEGALVFKGRYIFIHRPLKCHFVKYIELKGLNLIYRVVCWGYFFG